MNFPAPQDKRSFLDTAAVVMSAVCMLHCLALPVAMTILPVMNVALLSESTFHLIMMVFILPVSVVALAVGCDVQPRSRWAL